MESQIKAYFQGSRDITVHFESKPVCKIFWGTVDSLSVSAREVNRFFIPLQEMEIQGRNISVDVWGLVKKEIPYCIKTLQLEGTATISQESFTGLLRKKLSEFTNLDVKLSPGTVHLTVKTKFVELPLLEGNLSIYNSTKIYLEITELPFKSKEIFQEKIQSLLKKINPIIDIEQIDITSSVFRNRDISDMERKKWNIRLTSLLVQEGILKVSFSADKK